MNCVAEAGVAGAGVPLRAGPGQRRLEACRFSGVQGAVAGNSREGMLNAHGVGKAREQLQLRKLRLTLTLQSKTRVTLFTAFGPITGTHWS